MIKAVVFDLDDTLISEREYIKSGFKSVASKISKKHGLDEFYVYETMDRLFEESSRNVFNRLLDNLEVDYDIEYIKNLIKIYRNHMPSIKLYDDAKEILDYLKNSEIKLGIITDGYQITQKNKLKVLNIDEYFECIVITDELGREYWKPHRKPYDIVKETLGLQYEEIVYVGDNINKDFITANKLGMKTVMINRLEGVYSNIDKDESYKAKIEINTLTSLVEVLKLEKLEKVWG